MTGVGVGHDVLKLTLMSVSFLYFFPNDQEICDRFSDISE